MFNVYRSTYSEHDHYVRNSIGHLFSHIIYIVQWCIPYLIILRFCNVIDIHLDNLALIWIGYQVVRFITEIIDHKILIRDAEEQKERITGYYKRGHLDENDITD